MWPRTLDEIHEWACEMADTYVDKLTALEMWRSYKVDR